MAETDAQRRANLKYRKKNVRTVSVAFYPSDKDILEWVESKPSKAGYIKALIRADMEQDT